MASKEPSPGQMYARPGSKLWRRGEPGQASSRFGGAPAHKSIPGNEKADEWAELAAEEPDARGVEWMQFLDRDEVRLMPLPRSFAHLKRETSEKKNRLKPATRRDAESRLRSTRCRAVARQDGGQQFQEDRLEVISIEDRALPHRPAPGTDEEPAHSQVLAV